MKPADKLRRLTRIRHGFAEQDADVRDFERPLSKRGFGEAGDMAKRFLERGLVPDLILASAAVRTRETAECFAKVLGVAPRLLQSEDSLYLADGDHILEKIRAVGPRVAHLMVIGHNPGISAAAISLTPETISNDLPTCGTVTMKAKCADWSLIDRRCIRDGEKDAPKKFFELG